MPRLLLMGDVVTRCQRRADMEGVDVIKPPEWKALIGEQYAQLYSTVVKAGMRYFESVDTITATGAVSYALPADHDETIGIDRVLDLTSGLQRQLGELMIQERNRFSGQTGDAIAYAIIGQTVVLYPRATTGTYQHVYVPQAPDLSVLADTATIDVVTGDGEAFLVWGVAVKALGKTESDTSLAIQERAAAGQRFGEDVQMRALINPRRRIVMRSPLNDTWGGGWDGDFGDDPGGWWNR